MHLPSPCSSDVMLPPSGSALGAPSIAAFRAASGGHRNVGHPAADEAGAESARAQPQACPGAWARRRHRGHPRRRTRRRPPRSAGRQPARLIDFLCASVAFYLEVGGDRSARKEQRHGSRQGRPLSPYRSGAHTEYGGHAPKCVDGDVVDSELGQAPWVWYDPMRASGFCIFGSESYMQCPRGATAQGRACHLRQCGSPAARAVHFFFPLGGRTCAAGRSTLRPVQGQRQRPRTAKPSGRTGPCGRKENTQQMRAHTPSVSNSGTLRARQGAYTCVHGVPAPHASYRRGPWKGAIVQRTSHHREASMGRGPTKARRLATKSLGRSWEKTAGALAS